MDLFTKAAAKALLAAAGRVRVAVIDPNGGAEITGEVTAELSDTHVRLRCADGLVFAVAKANLRLLTSEEGVS